MLYFVNTWKEIKLLLPFQAIDVPKYTDEEFKVIKFLFYVFKSKHHEMDAGSLAFFFFPF